MLRRIVGFFNKRINITVFLLSLLYCSILFLYPDNFKLGVLILFSFIGILYLVTKNVFVSLFFSFILSFLFLLPAKIYSFEYASSREYIYELLKEGISENITLTLSDIGALFLVLWFARERIRQVFQKTKEGASFVAILNRKDVLLILLSWLIYFSVSLYSSVRYSVFPTFSLDLLFQYAKIVIVFLGIIHVFYNCKKVKNLFFIVLLAVLLFQSTIGSIQFVKSLTSYGSSEKLESIDIEENTGVSRIQGISTHPNSHALTTAILLALTMPYVIKKSKEPWWIISVLALFNIIFTQSRTVWFGLVIPGVLYYFQYRAIVNKKIGFLLKQKRVIFLCVLVAVSLLFIVIPRIQLTSIFFTSEGGGLLRFTMLSQGWELLQQNPFLGFGIGTGVRVFLDKMPNGYTHTFPFPVHNAYLQIALESGIPATIAFFLPFFLIVRALFKENWRKKLHDIAVLSIVSCILIIFSYYTIQPVYGRREYLFIGMTVALGSIVVNGSRKKSIYEIE